MGTRDRTKLTEFNCFFVTTTCNNWLNLLYKEDCFTVLYDSVGFVNKKYNASVVGYVFMPNHIHLILYFTVENHLSDYMRDFKKYTSVQLRKLIEIDHSQDILALIRYKHRQQFFKVWMDRFDDVVIKSTKILLTKLTYIHENPVSKGLVSNPWEYTHSSAGYYFKQSTPLMPLLHFEDII